VRIWLLDKAKAELSEAIHEESEAKLYAAEMMKRQRGKDGWSQRAWRGEGTKAKREHAKAKKRVTMLREVIGELEWH
jgi:hypothetical protein